MPDNDILKDLRNGEKDDIIIKRYGIKPEQLDELKQYNYAVTKLNMSDDQARNVFKVQDVLPIYNQVKGSVVDKYVKPVETRMASELPVHKPIQMENYAVNQKHIDQQTAARKFVEHKLDPRRQSAIDKGIPESLIPEEPQGGLSDQTLQSLGIKQKDVIPEAIGQPLPDASIKQTSVLDQSNMKTRLDNQRIADAIYENPVGKVAYNIKEGVWDPTLKFGTNLLAMGARGTPVMRSFLRLVAPEHTVDKIDHFVDAFVDYMDPNKRGEENRPDAFLYKSPTALQGRLFNDGKFNASMVIPTTVKTLTNMALLIGGGEVMGGGVPGIITSSYLSTEEEYRKDGAKANLKGGQLDAFANTASLLTSFLEAVSPNQEVVGKLKGTLLKDALKDIANGVSVNSAMKRAFGGLFKEVLPENLQELSQSITDHAVKYGFDKLGDAQFNEDLSYKGMKDEVLETIFQTTLATTLLMAPSTIYNYKPNNLVKSSMYQAAKNIDVFNRSVDAQLQAGKITQDQAEVMKNNVSQFSNHVNQLEKKGFSPDQVTRMAWAAYKDQKISQDTKYVNENPVIKETIGKEIKKDQEDLKNEVKDAAMGIPNLGDEISGQDLTAVVNNIGNGGEQVDEKLVDKIKDNNYLVEEMDAKDVKEANPILRIHEAQTKGKGDEDGLRTPIIVDSEGKIIDGKKRAAQQIVNGEEKVRVFRELKSQPIEVAQPNDTNVVQDTKVNQEPAQQSQEKQKEEISITDRIEKLNPYESDGYNVVRNRQLKEDMVANPEKAKLAFEIMDFAGKIWGESSREFHEKKPLAAISQFFYGDSNSLKEFVDNQIKAEEDSIKSNQDYIDSLTQSKSDKKSKLFFEKSIQETKNRIKQIKQAYANSQSTSASQSETTGAESEIPSTGQPEVSGQSEDAIVASFAKELGLPEDALPKHGTTGTGVNETFDNTTDALDKISEHFKGNKLVERAIKFLRPILEANPNIKFDNDFKFTDNALGYSFPDGRIAINFDRIGDKETLYRTILHEMVHAATRSEITNNTAFRDELSDVLSEVRDALKIPENSSVVSALVQAGVLDENLYGGANEHELLAEVFSNQKFHDYLKGIQYKGDSLLKRIYLAFAKFFSQRYRELTGAKESIDVNDFADYLMSLTESVIKPTIETSESDLNLAKLTKIEPSMLTKMYKLIKAAASAGKTKAEVVTAIQNATGADEDIASNIYENGIIKPDFKALPQNSSGQTVDVDKIPILPEGKKGIAKTAEKVVEKLKIAFKQLLTASRGLPEGALAVRDASQGAAQAEMRKLSKTIDEYNATVKKIKFTDKSLFDEALRTNDVSKLPDELKPIAVKMRAHIDGLSREFVVGGYVSPQQALEFQEKMGTYIHRAYKLYNEKNWANKIPPNIKQEAYNFLVQQAYGQITEANPNLSQEEAEKQSFAQAQKTLNDILAKVDDVQGFRTRAEGGRDLGITKQREDIPAEIRALMGEYTDPAVNYAITVAKMAAFKASSKFLRDMRTLGMGSLFFEENDPDRPADYNSELAAEGSKTYSPLNGVFTTKEIKQALLGIDDSHNSWIRGWMKVVGAIRWGKTVGSVVTQFKNFESNLGFAVMNGHYRVSGFKDARNYLWGELTNKDSAGKSEALVDKMERLKLVDQSVNLSEMKQMLRDNKLKNLIENAESGGNNFLASVYQYLNKVYGASDNFWKIYGFINESASLSEARYGKKYSDLTADEMGKIDTEASERVKNTLPTYDRVWQGAKILSKNIPLFGNFLSFQAESVRVLLNTFHYAAKDIKDPQTRSMGVRRLAGAATYITGRTGMLYAISQITGIGMSGLIGALVGNDDDQDQKLKDINEYVPPFTRAGDKIVRNEGSGKYVVYDISSLDPYGIWSRTMNAYTSGGEKVDEPGLYAATREFFEPYAELEMTAGALIDVFYTNEDARGDAIVNPEDPLGNQWWDRGAYFWKQMQPSTIGLIQRAIQREDKANETAALFGGRGYTIDVQKGFSNKLRQAEESFANTKNSYGKINSSPDSSDQDKADIRQKSNERMRTAIKKLHEQYVAAIRLGGNVDVLDEKLKNKVRYDWSKGYDRHVVDAIKTGDVDNLVIFE